ncbi:ATP-dependent DNA/RNA helicase [Polyrhizophydium stewartii]|uniref:RNA helicase n=1 Tax=Polyrhizophydium stewartii TaxID=2732419 RepID=A0ABR4N1J9_9FUNG
MSKQASFTVLQEHHVGSKATSIDWSSETLSRRLSDGFETRIALAAAFEDRSIMFYASGAAPLDVCASAGQRHQDAINDIAFDRVGGRFVASVSDDRTCHVWRIHEPTSGDEADQFPIVIKLKARGVSVRWNHKLSKQIMIGESSGAIRILDIETHSWLFSVFQPDKSGPEALLRSVDWNPHDPNLFGAVVGRRWFVWNMNGQLAMHLPEHSGEAHPEMGNRFRWCISDPKMFATSTNAPETPVSQRIAAKVFSNVFNQIPRALVLPSKSRLACISWNAAEPVLSGAAGSDMTGVTTDLLDRTGDGFADMGLDPRIQRAVAKLGFAHPTLVQAKAIPLALQGKDILARARTGSGKTAAYSIPIVQKILALKANDPAAAPAVRALVLVPTRELAEQVHRHIQQLAMYASKEIRSVNIATGDLPDIIVSTPARIIAHLEAGTVRLKDSVESLAIDEADLILSYGYDDDVKKLLGHLPRIYQSYLMSATLSADVDELKQLVLRNPAILKLEESPEEQNMLTQYYIKCEETDKFLLTFFMLKLHVHPFGSGKTIIFVNSIDRCYKLKLFLEQFGIRSCTLNSELPLKSRYHIVQEFNKGVYDIIIATDESGDLKAKEADTDSEGDGDGEGEGDGAEDAEADPETSGTGSRVKPSTSKKNKKQKTKKDGEYGSTRGIDFVNVQAVVNFDLPRSSRSYQHRVGRTARGVGNKGYALSFVEPAKDTGVLHTSRKTQKAALKRSASKVKLSSDEDLLRRIEKRQAAMGREILPFSFDMAQVEGFRYRCIDAMRAATTVAVREARLKEIKAEIINSEKLKAHFESNPHDLQALRHDKPLHSARTESHMRNVPTYLLPKGKVGVSAGSSSGYVPFRVDSKRRVSKKRVPTSAAAKRKADPLKSFSYRPTQ